MGETIPKNNSIVHHHGAIADHVAFIPPFASANAQISSRPTFERSFCASLSRIFVCFSDNWPDDYDFSKMTILIKTPTFVIRCDKTYCVHDLKIVVEELQPLLNSLFLVTAHVVLNLRLQHFLFLETRCLHIYPSFW